MTQHAAAVLELNPEQQLRQLLDHRGRLLFGVAAYGCVRIHGPLRVTATVCSKWAEKPPSAVMAVHLSASTFASGEPWFTMGSIASTIPSRKRGPSPAVP